MSEPESENIQPVQEETPKAPAEVSPEFPPADLNDIGSDFLENVPEAEPEFCAKLEQELADEMGVSTSFQNGEPAPAEGEILRDKNGHIFDPEIVKTDENGKPLFTTTGLFQLKPHKKRKMLKKQIRVPKQPTAPEQPEAPPLTEDIPPDDAAITAETIDALYWSGMSIFGAEKIDSVSEQGRQAMADGFRTMDNPPKLPWWVGVAAIYSSATAVILRREEAKPALEVCKDKIVGSWLKLRSWKRKFSGAEA